MSKHHVHDHRPRVSTPETKLLRAALERRGLRVYSEFYDYHKHIDIAIPDAKLNIEVDGPRHLQNAQQILSDIARAHGSDDLGYATLHIHNEELLMHLDKIADALAEACMIRIEQFKVLEQERPN